MIKRLTAAGLTAREIGERLGMSAPAVQATRGRLGLTAGAGQKAPDWSAAELEKLKELTREIISYPELQRHFPDRTINALKIKTARLGLAEFCHSGGREAMKPKQLFYPILAKFYATPGHTREETLKFVKKHGFDENFLKHFFWRIWPKYRKRRKSDAAALRYDFDSHIAFLKLCKTHSVSAKGFFFGGRYHNVSKLATTYKSHGHYWGMPKWWFYKITGASYQVHRFVNTKRRARADGKGYFIATVSWREAHRFLQDNKFFRDKVPPHILQFLKTMSRFEGWLESLTSKFPTTEDAVLHLMNRRATYGIESARKTVRTIRRNANRGKVDKPQQKLHKPKQKASRQARVHDGRRHKE